MFKHLSLKYVLKFLNATGASPVVSSDVQNKAEKVCMDH